MKTVNYILDTNVILRYLLGDHPRHSKKANDFFADVSKNKIKAEIPSFILTESIHVLSKFYKISKPEIIDSLTRLLNFQGIANQDRAELINALLIYKSANIAFPDCLLAAISTPHRKIVSFDSDFDKVPAFRNKL